MLLILLQECLLAGLDNKQPKIVITTVQTLTLALRFDHFSTKTCNVFSTNADFVMPTDFCHNIRLLNLICIH